MHYEYKAIPAPTKGLKAKGIKTDADRFAHAIATTLNILGAEGWEYQRAETLPAEQREGLMGKTTVYQNILIFRRPLVDDEITPMALPAPEDAPEDAAPEDTAPETDETDADEAATDMADTETSDTEASEEDTSDPKPAT